MHLVQFLLPVYDNRKRAFPKRLFDDVREHLIQTFGGVTAFVRSPAVGAWETEDGDVQRDDMVLFEVIADSFDRDWWQAYRRVLERTFDQEKILVRAMRVDCV